jgi:mRNA-degrading endonuclease RelE of RelBE toxin-antitoxin system
MSDVRLTRDPEKYLKSLSAQLKDKFITEMLVLEEDPEIGISLVGSFKGYYKIDFDFKNVSYRIIYRISWEENIVYIILLGPRENIYSILRRKLRRR